MTDELVEAILLPGLEPGAVDVFLEFICYSDGPLPEELLPQVKVRKGCLGSSPYEIFRMWSIFFLKDAVP